MKTLYLLWTLLSCATAFGQRSLKKAAEEFFKGIPIDSSFEYLCNHAKENNFTYIPDKSMDSSSLVYVQKLKLKKIYNTKVEESYCHIQYSDNLYVGDTVYKKAHSILYRLTFGYQKVKEMNRLFASLVKQFSSSCSRKESFRRHSYWSLQGVKFFDNLESYPLIVIDIFCSSMDGCVLSITYLKKDN